MKETGIIMSGSHPVDIIEGRKTMTRRVIVLRGKGYKFMREHGYDSIQHDEVIYPDGGGNWIGWDKDSPGLAEFTKKAYPNGEGFKCPYGGVGSRLWVRETWCQEQKVGGVAICYKADQQRFDGIPDINYKWRPSIFMPRWASRILLEITEIRAERLQEITEADAKAEGCPITHTEIEDIDWYRPSFQRLWDSLNAKRGYDWASNCWIWVIGFKVIR